MFDSDAERAVVAAAVFLWIALGWYLKAQLDSVHRKLERTLAAFNGLRKYLYEIDPQFDNERRLLEHLANRTAIDAGARHMELMQHKKDHSKRTLNTSFNDE